MNSGGLLCQEITTAFHGKALSRCHVFIEPNRFGMSPAKFDAFVKAKGLNPIQGQWKTITALQARSLFTDLCSRSMFHGHQVMPEGKANALAARFFAPFDPAESRYFTSLVLDTCPPSIRIHTLRHIVSGSLIPDAVLSVGLLVGNPDQIGLFVRGEWD